MPLIKTQDCLHLYHLFTNDLQAYMLLIPLFSILQVYYKKLIHTSLSDQTLDVLHPPMIRIISMESIFKILGIYRSSANVSSFPHKAKIHFKTEKKAFKV